MKVTLGQMYESLRGKNQRTGGSVLYPVAGRQFARQNVVPANPNTSFQQSRRGAFSLASKAFSPLNVATKAEWAEAAAFLPRTDANGQQYSMGALGLFVSVNATRLLSGLSTTEDSPTAISIGGPTVIGPLTIAVGGVTASIDITFSAEIVTPEWLFELTSPLPGEAKQPQNSDFQLATLASNGSYIQATTSVQTVVFQVADLKKTFAGDDRIGIRVTGFSDEFVKGGNTVLVADVIQAS